MLPVALPVRSSALEDSSSSSPASPHFFLEDGRQICVGDCALFKTPCGSLPFIGIIRKLRGGKGDRPTTLGVNWLYRPSDVKLGEGSSLEAAPNEVFYSFCKDEIPAGSLLHPCKVAFLRRGAELPWGVSSFVCRRVYDIDNTSLRWLTDKDYVNEWHEEIVSLLNRTRLEMHGAVESGGRSPKPLNGQTPESHLKLSADSGQNSESVSSHGKSKKRDRGDRGCNRPKRERLHKTDDCDSGQTRAEFVLKSEIADITDRGGLVSFDGVEKLIQLMQPEAANRKADLGARIMLADVISATDRSDCLGRIVQLGLPVLDDWLQDVHKGKVGSGSNPRVNDNSVEGYLFSLLRALDKLPVDLHALQSCNIGKSVNHLRTHKSAEIQKKARSLVDTWKKRVQAEMNVNNIKPGQSCGGSWPTKPVPLDGYPVGNKKFGATVDVAIRDCAMQSSVSISYQVKVGAGEGISKFSGSSGFGNSSTSNLKDTNVKASAGSGNPELSLAPIKEERYCSSCHSQNNSQSCSGDHTKTVGSFKEDSRSSTTESASKSPSGASWHGKSTNGVNPVALSEVRKEIGSTKVGSLIQNSASERFSPTGSSQERSTELNNVDNGNSQHLIFNQPYNVQSLPSGVGGIYYVDPAARSGKISPAKHETCEGETRAKNEVLSCARTWSDMNSDTCTDCIGGFEDGNVVPTSDEKHETSNDVEKTMKVLNDAGSLLVAMPQTKKSYDAAMSSMNALVESCLKMSEASGSASSEDDIGMNLLATVAAAEILKSENPKSPISTQRHSGVVDGSYSYTDGNPSTMDLEVAQLQQTEDRMVSSSCSKEVKEDCTALLNTPTPISQQITGVSRLKFDVMSCGLKCDSFATFKIESSMEVEGAVGSHNGQAGPEWDKSCSQLDSDSKLRSPMPDGVKHCNVNERVTDSRGDSLSDSMTRNTKIDQGIHENLASSSLEMDGTKQNNDKQELSSSANTEWKQLPAAPAEFDSSGKMMAGAYIDKDLLKVAASSPATAFNITSADDKSAGEEARAASLAIEQATLVPTPKNEPSATSSTDKLASDISDGSDGHASGAKLVPGTRCSVKVDFDLNEGFLSDEGNQEEAAKQADFGFSYSVNLPYSSTVSIPPTAMSFPTSITVAAAAKGSFVPPENLLHGKGELGWKGSAATSAFRPAEPRRTVDVHVNARKVIAGDTAVIMQSRRPLDFDLNIADEPVLEDVCGSSERTSCSWSGRCDGSGGLDLDLNRLDENYEAGTFCLNISSMSEAALETSRPSLASAMSNVGSNTTRDFDLNNGPSADELGTGIASCGPPMKNNLPFPPSMTGSRINGAEFGYVSSWFTPMNSYSAFTIPSILTGRGEKNFLAATGPQKIMAAPSSSTSLGLEMYGSPELPSSQAVPFTSTTLFPYSGLPREPSFPSSNSFSGSTVYGHSTTGGPLCFPAMPPQLVGPTGVITSPFSRPFVTSLPSFSSGLGFDSRRWASQLDLNSGPGGIDLARSDEKPSTEVKQHSISGSQLADERLKAYHLPGGIASAGSLFNRKEPDGAWDSTDRFSCKVQQPSPQ